MRCAIYSSDDTFLRWEDIKPECGEDFCEKCGDCLHCFPDVCSGSNESHLFVRYEDHTADEEVEEEG